MKTIHKLCYHIRYGEAVERNLRGKKFKEHATCKECPAWERIPNYGMCQRGCYGVASEVLNIVKWGNPWGRKYRYSRRSWPDRSKYAPSGGGSKPQEEK